jgi:hypothetical protein
LPRGADVRRSLLGSGGCPKTVPHFGHDRLSGLVRKIGWSHRKQRLERRQGLAVCDALDNHGNGPAGGLRRVRRGRASADPPVSRIESDGGTPLHHRGVPDRRHLRRGQGRPAETDRLDRCHGCATRADHVDERQSAGHGHRDRRSCVGRDGPRQDQGALCLRKEPACRDIFGGGTSIEPGARSHECCAPADSGAADRREIDHCRGATAERRAIRGRAIHPFGALFQGNHVGSSYHATENGFLWRPSIWCRVGWPVLTRLAGGCALSTSFPGRVGRQVDRRGRRC